jgi:hypothetical protein
VYLGVVGGEWAPQFVSQGGGGVERSHTSWATAALPCHSVMCESQQETRRRGRGGEKGGRGVAVQKIQGLYV